VLGVFGVFVSVSEMAILANLSAVLLPIYTGVSWNPNECDLFFVGFRLI
jgi:hypothetical protein